MKYLKKVKELHLSVGFFRYSTFELLCSLILLIATMPFVDGLSEGEVIEPILITIVLICALMAVGGRKKVLMMGFLLLLPAIATRWLHHFFPSLIPHMLYFSSGLIFIVFVVANIFKYVLRAQRVNTEVICAGISIYLLMGMIWSIFYRTLGQMNPNAFMFVQAPNADMTMTSFNAFYFSFSTLSSVGYGDITPVSKGARMMAVMETITGIFYVAVMISRLVTLYTPKLAAPAEDPDTET